MSTYMGITQEEAQIILNKLFQDFGVPEHAPFVGDVWQKTTQAFIAAIKAQGIDAIQQALSQAVIAGAVLAGVQPPQGA